MTILFLVTLILLLSAQQLVDELTVQQTSATESSLNSQQRPGQHKKWRVKINIFHAIHTSQTQQDSAMSKQADWFGVHRELNLDLSVIPSIFTSTQFPHSAQICFLPKDGSWPVLISTSIPLQRWTWDLHVLGCNSTIIEPFELEGTLKDHLSPTPLHGTGTSTDQSGS